MSMSRCNYCSLKKIREQARKEGKRVYLRTSNFMNGTDVFAVSRGSKLPLAKDMISPCDKYPNGNEAYVKYHVAWMMSIPDRCCCL